MPDVMDRVSLTSSGQKMFSVFIATMTHELNKRGIEMCCLPDWQANVVEDGKLRVFLEFKCEGVEGTLEMFVMPKFWYWKDQN